MNAIITTAILTGILLLALETILLETYRAGVRKGEQNYIDKLTELEEVMNDCRMKLADVRVREKIAKGEKR